MKALERTKVNMRKFYQCTDWGAWWEEFYKTLDVHGHYVYRTIHQFAKTKAKSRIQLKFICWLLGPDQHMEALAEKYPFCKPQDWMKRRVEGGWWTDDSLRLFSKQVRMKTEALDALREAGNGVTINFMSRVEHLARAIDEAFHGQVFLPNLDFKDNLARTRCYLALHEDLIRMQNAAFDLYAKAHGINFQDMDGFSTLVNAQINLHQNANVQLHQKTGVQIAIERLQELTVTKAAKYNLPLPDEMKTIVGTVVVDEDDDKQNVQ